jgi:prolyl oligopeptidase
MKIIKFLFLVVIGYSCTKNKNKPIKMLPEQKVVDKYFGVEVEDSYRYMENTSDSIVINWYKQQSKYSKNQLHKITNRDKIIDFQNKTRGSKEIKVFNLQITNNNIYFYLKNNKDVKELFFRKGITGKEHLLLNPNNFKKGYSINYISPNWDGSKIAIAVTKDDLEIGDIIIFDVIKNVLFQEIINNCWPSALGGVKWLSDNKRFTYEYIPIIDKNNEDYLLNIETRMHIVSQQTVNDITLFSKTNNPEITIKEEDFPEITFKDEKEENDMLMLNTRDNINMNNKQTKMLNI